MKLLRQLISIEEDVNNAGSFSQDEMTTSFIKTIQKNYPLVFIDETLFKIILISYFTAEINTATQYKCMITISDELRYEVAEHYPEAVI